MALSGRRKTSILIVEDDAGLRGLLKAAFTAAGYRVVAVEDGVDALRSVEREIPSAVVLDMALPRLGGRDVHQELKSRPDTCNLPVIVVSGTDISDLDPSEFACLLCKPIHTDAVVHAVNYTLLRVGGFRGSLTT